MNSKAKKYGNCRVYSPIIDGESKLMFLCNMDRLEWYLKKDLAEIIQEEPHIEARLKFKPNGFGYAGQDDFYFTPKEDQCVKCGNKDYEVLTRHHIVPYCYRRWMPYKYKSHNCYDVVKMCRVCHNNYEIHAQELKAKIANELDVDIYRRTTKISNIKSCANTLLNHMTKLPNEVFDRMYSDLSDYLGKLHITEEDLEYLINMEADEDPEWKSWGRECVDKLIDLQSFIIMWRQHFLDYANPDFMPDGWSIFNESKMKN